MRHCLFLSAVLAPLVVQAADGLQLSSGLDYSSGSYGGASTTEISTAFVMGRYTAGPLSFKLTLPYLELKGPAIAMGGGDAMVIAPGSAATLRGRVAGQGDVVASLGYEAWHDPEKDLALDVAARIKFPTADASKGLGTGERDLALQLNAYKGWGRATLLLGMGYRWMGKPEGSSYRDVLSASAGLAYGLDELTSVGGIVDWRQSVLASLADQRELTLYVSHKLSRQWSLQAYVYAGATDASPDAGGGASLGYRF